MPFETLTDGLTIKVPTRKTKNWDSVVRNQLFQPISAHGHTGSGDGKQITTAAIAANAVDDTKVRLRNNQWLIGRNSTDTGNVNIVRVTDTNGVEINATLTQNVGVVYLNETGAAPTGLTAGRTYMQPNFILSSAITYTLVTGAFMEIVGFLQIDGTLIVEGQARVV